MPKYGFIGGGRMASAMVEALLSGGHAPAEIAVSDKSKEVLAYHRGLGVGACESNIAVCDAEYVFLAVKPQHLTEVLTEVGPQLEGKNIVSIVAGVKTEKIGSFVKNPGSIVRVMPNTPMLLGRGAVAISFGNAPEAVKTEVKALFSSRGLAVEVSEAELDAVTALSGSGPAYFYRFAKVLADSAAELGLESKTALQLAIATMAGAAEMMAASGKTPDELIRDVSSPGGTTVAALAAFDEENLDQALSAGVKAAYKRSKELSD